MLTLPAELTRRYETLLRQQGGRNRGRPPFYAGPWALVLRAGSARIKADADRWSHLPTPATNLKRWVSFLNPAYAD
jgi:hypothetical protein